MASLSSSSFCAGGQPLQLFLLPPWSAWFIAWYFAGSSACVLQSPSLDSHGKGRSQIEAVIKQYSRSNIGKIIQSICTFTIFPFRELLGFLLQV